MLSNENTELAITTQRRRQWKQEDEEMGWNSDDEDPYYETTWTCYFRRGTRRGAFVLLAKFISEHFAFQDLRIEGLDKELSQALSKFRFYTKDYLKIEKAENFDGEDLLSWADMPHSRWLRFESTTPFSFKKTIFDDRRISCRESIDISVSEPNHGSCDVSNSELVELMTRRTHVKLQNIETEVMLGDLKAFINNWSSCGDDFTFSRWTFGIRLDAEDKSIGALYDNILEGHERTKSINYFSKQSFYAHHKKDQLRRLAISLEFVSPTASNLPLLNVSLHDFRKK